MRLPVLAAAPVTIRHVTTGAGAGAITVLGASFVTRPRKAINGRRGYSSGSYESSVGEEGSATLTLPNTAGDDGVLHRRRFQILTEENYHPGDEWLEITQDGHVLFVGTPIDREVSRSTVMLQLNDALWMLNTQRETAAGFWSHAPRDVFEHYTKAWISSVADEFDDGADAARWTKQHVTDIPGLARLARVVGVDPANDAILTARSDFWGAIPLASQRAWRLEVTYRGPLATGSAFLIGMGDVSLPPKLGAPNPPGRIYFAVQPDGVGMIVNAANGALDASAVRRTSEAMQGSTLALECRDRFLFGYVDGTLMISLEWDAKTDVGNTCVPFCGVNGSVAASVDVSSVLLRRCEPFLMRTADKGDQRLPGLLPAGGLKGTYYDESDLRAYGDASPGYYRRVLAPTRQPYARRQDPVVNFPQATPPTWMPPTPPNGEYFSVRWTGAIYLDLTAADVTLRLTQLDNAARLWVGRTTYGQQLLDQWLSPAGAPFTLSRSLRDHLGTQQSGWYPIRIDFAQGAGGGGIVLQRSIGAAAYEVVPATDLSPLGIYEAQVRYDSHAEQLKAIALAYGLQYRCEPRVLESGEFPGTVVPRVRVGRDTDKILTTDESTDASAKGSASEVIDTLLADAAGLADQANDAQLTAESVNYQALTGHMMILTAYESLADITDPVLLQTRLASMLGLRVTPWEEISARPRGHTELRDTLPMTGEIARFAWEPGDGLRVIDDQLDVRDLQPRQLMVVSWPFVPDGRGAPNVTFRQRPRTQQNALRALARGILLPQRNYQGQLAIVPGTWSNLDSGYSRVALPRDLNDIKRCELVIGYKNDASTWTIHDLAGSTLATFTSTGRIDLLAYLQRRGTGPMMIITATGGTGTAEYQLSLVVSV